MGYVPPSVTGNCSALVNETFGFGEGPGVETPGTFVIKPPAPPPPCPA